LLSNLSPEFVYLVLLGALWLCATAIYLPGTGIVEAIAFGVLAAALFVLTRQPTNWGAALILMSGTLTFLTLPFFCQRYAKFAIGGLVLQVLGSVFLFNSRPLNPLMIAFTVGASLAYYQFLLLPAMRRLRSMPTQNEDEKLVGTEGVVVTALNPTGTVKLRGETWTAYSDESIASGERVSVIKRDGLQLYVEHMKHKRMPNQEEETVSE
jgi:membrane-bound serine protease (ClpP class)